MVFQYLYRYAALATQMFGLLPEDEQEMSICDQFVQSFTDNVINLETQTDLYNQARKFESKMLELVSIERTNAGVPPLQRAIGEEVDILRDMVLEVHQHNIELGLELHQRGLMSF